MKPILIITDDRFAEAVVLLRQIAETKLPGEPGHIGGLFAADARRFVRTTRSALSLLDQLTPEDPELPFIPADRAGTERDDAPHWTDRPQKPEQHASHVHPIDTNSTEPKHS